MMPIQFAVGCKAWACLLALVPILSLFWWIICGLNGAQWAWNSGMFRTPQEFNKTMQVMNRMGLISLVAIAVVIVIYVIFAILLASVFATMGNSWIG